MKSFKLWHVGIAAALIILPSLAFSGDNLRPDRRSFFAINPSLRADVLALEAEKKEDDLMKMAVGPTSPFSNNRDNWETLTDDNINEIELIGLKMSLSRFALAQDQAKGGPFGDEGQAALPDLWPLLFRGSFRTGDFETLGEFFRPQLNLGIEF
jgi:hypothetical protein